MSEQDKTEDAKSEEQQEETTQETESTESEEVEGEEALGDAGKRALDLMKIKVKAAEKKARDATAEIAKRDAAAALADKPAEEQALEAARAEGRTEAKKASDERYVKSELKAAAKGKLADPTDAALYIDLADFTVDDDGNVDSDALDAAIDELIEKKPHLAAQKQNRFNGDADGGAKGKDAKPQQLTKADVDGMTPEQIMAAKDAGQLNTILGIK